MGGRCNRTYFTLDQFGVNYFNSEKSARNGVFTLSDTGTDTETDKKGLYRIVQNSLETDINSDSHSVLY